MEKIISVTFQNGSVSVTASVDMKLARKWEKEGYSRTYLRVKHTGRRKIFSEMFVAHKGGVGAMECGRSTSGKTIIGFKTDNCTSSNAKRKAVDEAARKLADLIEEVLDAEGQEDYSI